ncbi:MAG: N,N'-diacetylchitobiose phosphorylase [Christensenellaceae bacterium]|nr:N,N'-diacetylchitobiose phosphorylase [Christensenellaceae bacterium]MEA5066072.1 N,N'-diacetylchitobiose phosphorylase [Eubacteriales bacterium]MEA5067689.1 N,N'-diacetylchitobiose phosphorylase [Christensenellaceae bacterium]
MRYGFFDAANREYAVERVDVPVSWTNYLGTQRMGAVVNHTAGGYAWLNSPQYHRITRFRPNGVPLDRPGYYLYLRDEADGDFWSVSWQPVGKPLDQARYGCRHGLSYSTYTCAYKDISASQTLFIPRDDDVLLWDVRVSNDGDAPRSLSAFGYLEFSFHHIDMDNQNFQMSLYAAGSSYVDGAVEYELHYEPNSRQFFTANFTPDGYDCLRDAFIGVYGSESNPRAVAEGRMSNSFEKCGNHCGALQKKFTLQPGGEVRLIFLLGQGDAKAARAARERYPFEAVDRAFAALKDHWAGKLDRLQVDTPSENMNHSLNLWNLYQAEVNVTFSRFASFIEVGGRTGLGYRDTAQDAMCVPHSNPGMCLTRIRQLLRGQVGRGYGLHLFDPAWFEEKETPPFKSPTVVPTPDKSELIHGLKDVCADDALWLIPAICEYLKETGDMAFLDEVIPYADEGEATVYGHMKQILEFSWAQRGANGVCKGLRADWNDCLNLGGGESAMVSALYVWAGEHFLALAERLGKPDDVALYGERHREMKRVCQTVLWDGRWFLRGFTGDGRKIGSDECAEGKVHLESNAWAVVSGAATEAQGRLAMDAVDEYLYTPFGLMLNAPCFETIDDAIGFVTRVYPGVKENGAIFSHSNPWAWVAECRLGRGTRAMKFYDALLPAGQNDMIELRQSEPYSYCQFIMGEAHTAHGRARHPWMTGSAGWAYYAATRYMLGVRPDYDSLTIDPCIPAGWDGFKLRRVWRGAVYEIEVVNPGHVEKGVTAVEVDGESVRRIPCFPESTRHRVKITMG